MDQFKMSFEARDFIKKEFLPLLSSILIVNTFIHLGSFVLELGCFAVLWCVQSYCATSIKSLINQMTHEKEKNG